MTQATVEYCSVITNLNIEKSTLKEQVALYANRLSTKEADKVGIQMAIKNLQGEVNNLKGEVAKLNKSGHSGGAGSTKKYNGIITPNWKREGQAHHPTW